MILRDDPRHENEDYDGDGSDNDGHLYHRMHIFNTHMYTDAISHTQVRSGRANRRSHVTSGHVREWKGTYRKQGATRRS